MNSITVTIISRNRKVDSSRLLKQLCKQTVNIGKIIFVEDVSEDQHHNYYSLKKMFSEMGSEIVYVKTKVKSIPKSRNLALKYITGDYLIFVDDDVQINPDTIEIAYEALRRIHHPRFRGLRFYVEPEFQTYWSKFGQRFMNNFYERDDVCTMSYTFAPLVFLAMKNSKKVRETKFNNDLCVGEDMDYCFRLAEYDSGFIMTTRHSVRHSFETTLAGTLRKQWKYAQAFPLLHTLHEGRIDSLLVRYFPTRMTHVLLYPFYVSSVVVKSIQAELHQHKLSYYYFGGILLREIVTVMSLLFTTHGRNILMDKSSCIFRRFVSRFE